MAYLYKLSFKKGSKMLLSMNNMRGFVNMILFKFNGIKKEGEKHILKA